MNEKNIINNIIEALLFASGDSISLKEIAQVIEKEEEETKILVLDLMQIYEKENRGIKIIEIENSFQMCTNPDYFPYLKNLNVSAKKKALSQAMIETLSIIAYKQPITKAQIEDIRGINSDYCVNNLVKLNLIEEKGRLDNIGKPILFATTEDFLKYFGLNNLEQLPTPKTDEEVKLMLEQD